MHTYSYLAMGDSYTIGEAVSLYESFPYQLVSALRDKEYNFNAAEIIAKTGWTTDELQDAIRKYPFLPKYDFVTLLIGVNNQYRGREVIEYKQQLEELLEKAISLASGKKERVFLVSIPDYSLMPFFKEANKEKIAREIDVFNSVGRALCVQYKVSFVDITSNAREAEDLTEMTAADKIHPSPKAYAQWVEKLLPVIAAQLK
jgi:lysophospholipase L1-like esterase